ncbi:MAG: excinuclease ABC subunit UvrA [Myxococcales bacterium]|nr:excinuclease ABC subunit UvrA [Myxococcales bacterium]
MSAPRDPTAQAIEIRGARVHNLADVDLSIPRDQLVVITGLSGSGKSSLAFDTLYAEGQRRYVESLSAYARQFLARLAKPDVDTIEGLSPAIAIEQKSAGRNPRSTLGTITEIADYLRLLFARLGAPHCWQCGKAIESHTVQQMTDRVLALPEGTRLQLLAPAVRDREGDFRAELEAFRRQGFVRARIDGEPVDLAEEIRLSKSARHHIEVVVDRVVVAAGIRGRVAESIETTLQLADGLLKVDVGPGEVEWLLSERNTCLDCGLSLPELAPRLFSFNTPQGACPACDGLGHREVFDPARIVPDPGRSLAEGAIAPWSGPRSTRYYSALLDSLVAHFDLDAQKPWRALPAKARKALLEGSGRQRVRFAPPGSEADEPYQRRWDGVLGELQRRFEEAGDAEKESLRAFRSARPCPDCAGSRLRAEARAVRVGGQSIDAISRLSASEALAFFETLALGETETAVARPIQAEICRRLRFLVEVGVGYLGLDRASPTLSGGEAQRIRLATQVGAGLVGVLYILDEPSIGLHSRDNQRLLDSLLRLRDQGNSLVVVEHDASMIRAADHVIDMGPGAGIHGGRVVATGSPADIQADPDSLTGAYLSGRRRIPRPPRRRPPGARSIVVTGCSENNLKDVTLCVPLGLFTVVTGVSGSGKSSLVTDTLYRILAARLHKATATPGQHQRVRGLEELDKVTGIDQAPIGRTPRSNPATYTGILDGVRTLFSQVPEARVRGYTAGRFSANVKGGRCESCQGEGTLRVEMHFLPDVFVTCEVCRGRRYNRETLEILYKGRSIADVLEMTVEEALGFLSKVDSLKRPLQTLHDVGLDYIRLGQPATTLSGGEAQRVKLARELSRRSTTRTLYLLDEPTTGLHFADVERLLALLDRLVEAGNSVVVIEHDLDVIQAADHVIDLGPEGGAEGGRIVVEGTPEQIAECPVSHTGRALAEFFRARDAQS